MPEKKHVVVLSGAGVSAESGLKTFRDAGGLWEGHSIEDVATPEAFARNPQLVLEFYNQRRKQLYEVEPNAGHFALAALQNHFEVSIVTQNVDDLHERAGSGKVIHLHGELKKVRSSRYPELIRRLEGWELKLGDLCERGYQLRPHIVWFGEPVPAMVEAMEVCNRADIFIVAGTSLQVYPAAGLIHSIPDGIPMYYVDPSANDTARARGLHILQENSAAGLPRLMEELIHTYKTT